MTITDCCRVVAFIVTMLVFLSPETDGFSSPSSVYDNNKMYVSIASQSELLAPTHRNFWPGGNNLGKYETFGGRSEKQMKLPAPLALFLRPALTALFFVVVVVADYPSFRLFQLHEIYSRGGRQQSRHWSIY